jgi:predicted MFS family arabinose efflux permease
MNLTAPSRHPDARWIVVVLAAICAGLHIWDLPAAIPSVRQDLAMTLVEAGALLGVVQLAGMLGGLAVSLLAELAGERRCLLTGLAMASLGSAVGAAAPSVTALMVSRAIEGAGSIMVMVTGPGLIRRHAAQPRINTAIGYWGASTGIAAFVGLAGSAVILQVASWRLLWWVVTALTLASLPLAAAVLPAGQSRSADSAAAAVRRIGVTVRSPRPWIAGLAFACLTIQWMTVVGFLPTIYAQNGLRGLWPGVLTAVVGGLGAAGSIGTGPLLQRGVPVRALLIPAFAAMAVTSVLTFAVNWAVLPAGTILQLVCVAAYSLSGAAIPATLFRIGVDLAPPAGSAPAVIGLMQQLFSVGGVAGPAIAAWLVTLTGSWQSMWWMTCTFAGLGGLLSLYLSERRLRITVAPRHIGCQPATAAGGERPAVPSGQPAHA